MLAGETAARALSEKDREKPAGGHAGGIDGSWDDCVAQLTPSARLAARL
jgi:hypothetical protein